MTQLGKRLLTGVRVIVVDDNADQLEILGALLTRAGARVVACLTAQEAFDAFQSDPPDIIVSDLAMPSATGYNLIRRIRRSGAKGADAPALAVTAFPIDEHWQKALDAGFTEWLPKPAADAVVATVARLTGRG